MAIELYFGDSMSGKSQAIERLMHHFHTQTSKKSRVYIGDGGAETYNAHGGVDDGWIEVMDFSGRPYPMTVLKLMTDFYFEKEPGGKLVPPPLDLFDRYAVMAFEGGTVMGQWMLSDVPGGFGWHAATETGFGGVKDEDDLLHYDDEAMMKEFGPNYSSQGANSPKHFYQTQRKLVSAIRASKKFPGLVIWTAHPTEAPDKTEGGESDKYGKVLGKKIIGPDFGGKAMASLIMKEFGNTLHFDTVTLPNQREQDPTSKRQITQVDREYRIYTRRHRDPDDNVKVDYIAGNRCAVPDMMPDYITSKTPGDAILMFYQTMAEARR